MTLLWETGSKEALTSDTSGRPIGSTRQSTAAGLDTLIGRQQELATLRELLAIVRGSGSGALLVLGEPGVGKSALLEQLIASERGFQVARAVGVEGEVDLPYAGLHQLCRSMLDTMSGLPDPQRDALHVAFGLSVGDAPERYLVGLAALNLMSAVAAREPLLCVVDDAQWLDPETMRALAFVARRLGADSVGLVFASREAVGELESVPELHLGGLSTGDSRVLLDSVLIGHIDGSVRDRFLAETHGNPLALIELPRALTAAEAATGIVRQSRDSLTARIEESFTRQLEPLPTDTRQILLLAAAEPLGDPLLLVRASAQLGLAVESADPAAEAGLFQIRERCSFRHPLVRSAVYGAATPGERRLAHSALAESTDSELDPDRRAWHRAQATSAPDEAVATELERTAARAKARGGLAAAGTFLERAAILTPDTGRRVERFLVSAEVMFEAGALASAEDLLRAIDAGHLDEIQLARLERLEAELLEARGDTGTPVALKLLSAAERLKERYPTLAYESQLRALSVAFWSRDPDALEAVSDALAEDPASVLSTAALVFRGWAQLLEQGYPAGTDLLRQAMVALRDKRELEERDLPLLPYTEGITRTYWDIENWEALARRRIQLARDVGALLSLPDALVNWAHVMVARGDLLAAAAALAEAEAISDATGVIHRHAAWLDAWRFDEAEAVVRIDRAERENPAEPPVLAHARAVVYNAAGRYEAALAAAEHSCELHPTKTHAWALVDLIEAAVRCDEHDRAGVALAQLTERTRLASTEWGLGLEARCAALVADDVAAEAFYTEAIERLARARTRPDLARAHLLYGEWLRRGGRRLDAREQLRTAYDMFGEMGIPGFAERTRRELAATGETARKRTDDTRGDLTAQEAQIAQLASEGLTNPEIGVKLFLSPRTVEWHLRRVYPKLGISSRKELRAVLQVT